MASYDSLIIGEDWISEHYFTTDATKESFQAEVNTLRGLWNRDEKEGHVSPRTRFLAGCQGLLAGLAGVSEISKPKALAEAARAVHAHVRAMLGYPTNLASFKDFSSVRADVPVTAEQCALTKDGQVLLLEALPVEAIEEFFNTETSRLLTPVLIEGKPQPLPAKALSELYRSATPPAFIVVLAGPWVVVTEAERWAEGRYLAVNLQLVAERRDEKRGAEVDRAVACTRVESVLPAADESLWWADVLEKSLKHTVGVSKDLRRGIRDSVEIIANDVVQRLRALTKNVSAPGVPTAEALNASSALEQLDANELAKQSLRFLYRILFVLYAEASPELKVLPAGAPEYTEGYGIDRLRDLTLVELASARAKQGTHLYESLALLFRLIDQGHQPSQANTELEEYTPSLVFNSLRADLFSPQATSYIDRVGLSNEATQQVLQNLLLTNPNAKGKDRGFISYAELGINQLGSVYEGLMSYSGFLAAEDLYEVAPKGDATDGSWVVPVSEANGIDPQDFVRKPNPLTGEMQAVLHKKGTFVYRLSNRERQRSASYYSPEVLTRFVVSQTLAEYFGEGENKKSITSDDVLQMTICEPALGSGAFAIEAVRQLAAKYLELKQEELGEIIDADAYPTELQKVKAHIALHQVYGVDLNATAVELAEVSLWLDTMFEGLEAPWFGLHLRRGNSLVGARPAVYSELDLKKKTWTKHAGTQLPVGEDPAGAVFQFLLPRADWAAAQDHKEAKEYDPETCRDLKNWRASMLHSPSATQKKRLKALSQQAAILWDLATRRLRIAEQEIHRSITLWGQEEQEKVPAVTREQVEASLRDGNSAYQRLSTVMDIWCALCYWPTTLDPELLPTWEEWLDFLEGMLGILEVGDRISRKNADQESLFGADTWDTLEEREHATLLFSQCEDAHQLLDDTPWAGEAKRISDREGFFHWWLDFAPLFADNGGFDIMVGNPPWVRPTWEEAGVLAELDPWWQLNPKAAEGAKRHRKEQLLESIDNRVFYLDEVASHEAQRSVVSHPADYPLLAGTQPDLYRCFMTRTWELVSADGTIGLIHPESHLTEKAAIQLRIQTYRRLRRHFQFINELKLFEIHHSTIFGVHIYSSARTPSFLQLCGLYHPDSALRSFAHDGSGPLPAIKNPAGGWDLRPHRDRITHVNKDVLKTWASLNGDEVSDWASTKMLYFLNSEVATVGEKLAGAPRLKTIPYNWTSGWHETGGKKAGYFQAESTVPSSLNELLILGPHFSLNCPFHRTSNPTMKNNQDYTLLDLETLPHTFIPRTNYKLLLPEEEALQRYPRWEDLKTGKNQPSTAYYTVVWRRMVGSAAFRTLQPALLPPGIRHPDNVITAEFGGNQRTSMVCAFWSSLIFDFLVKVSGLTHANASFLEVFPLLPENHPLAPELLLRTLRLNCLTADFADLWEELYDPAWQDDTWVPGITTNRVDQPALGDIGPEWTMETPLRRAQDRRQAQVEIDAIAAIMLGLNADDLDAIYTTQFQVLKQNYEDNTIYDPHGRQMDGDELKAHLDAGTTPDGYARVNRQRDMRLAYEHFTQKMSQH